jgi:hypothetical protein
MEKKILKSLRELSVLKRNIPTSSNGAEAPGNRKEKHSSPNLLIKTVTESGVSPWEPVFLLLTNKLFDDIASGLIDKISSKNYSVVLAVLTYPKKADSQISQEQLDRAHDIATRIKRGLKAGRIKYTYAQVPSPWRINGNPGTKK